MGKGKSAGKSSKPSGKAGSKEALAGLSAGNMPVGTMPAHEVGQPLRARLIALERRIGLFSLEDIFAPDSRFNHPVMSRPIRF